MPTHKHSTASFSRVWLLVLLTLFGMLLPGCIGCGGETAPPEGVAASVLRRSFPEQAGNVLDPQGEEGFLITEEGFALGGGAGAGAEERRGIEVKLPREGGGAILFRGGGGFEVRVWESGLEGEGELAEGAVAYRRAGGTSFWVATAAGGVEEWLHLEAGVARAGEVVATWEVEGASVRQHGEAVEVVDESGWVRLLVTAPVAYAAGGREVKARLEGRAERIELSVDAGGEEVLVDPAWSPVGSLGVGRVEHTATPLANGKVLVVGGRNAAAYLASAELYDPATSTWSSAGAMSTARHGHTATRLANGKVLVVGGRLVATAELYDPATNTWTAAGNMGTARYMHTATLLGNGKVLVAGGDPTDGFVFGPSCTELLASAQLYDPANNTWSSAASMSAVRYLHTATLLGNGKVLVVGGYDGCTGGYLASATVYDPVTNTWAAAASLSAARYRHTATMLGNGKEVLVAGGEGSGVNHLASAEIYDVLPNTWRAAGSLSTGRSQHTAALLGNGKVLVAGGYPGPLASAEIYDPLPDTWTAAGAMSTARYMHTATLLANGYVLVAGGQNGSYLASAELYTSLGSACALPSDCPSGFCADGVCCNTACDAGPCDACSVAAGAATDGTCALLTGPACDDDNACTQTDTCQAGTCTGANPVTCSALDQCHVAGVCDPGTGACSNPNEANGTACNDGDACTQTDTCQAGTCTGANPVTCAALDQCHVAGVCDPGTGVCSNPSKADGSACSDSNACTQTDTCQAGTCTGANPVTCSALDQCHVAGVCDPGTGACSNPNEANGTACNDGDACTQTDTCQAGTCTGANPVTCSAPDECHEAGTCSPGTGLCSTSPKPDGAPCSFGACQGGFCTSLSLLSALAAGTTHSLALLDNGSVHAWGSDVYGQLGDGGASTNRSSPIAIPALAGMVLVDPWLTTLSAGGSHSLAVLSDGRVAAWGSDLYGQLGNDLPKAHMQAPVFFTLPSGTPALAVSAGRDHSLAIDADGAVWAWGRNLYGQLGDGSQTDRPAPVQVVGLGPGLQQVIAIAAGGDHSFALDSNGRLWAWGRDAYGQLGDTGILANQPTPVEVMLPSLSVVVAVASGADHGMALLSDDTLWTWGRDTTGQLGDGSPLATKPTPVQVATLSGVLGIAAGGNHSLARLADGTVWSWGADSSGQLGDDAVLANKPAPVPVSGVSWVDMLAAGGMHSLFGLTSRTIHAAGLDTSGQLGNGSPLASQPVPQSYIMP